MKPRISSTKALTPHQRVLAKYPKAYSQWVPGAGMWRIVEAVAGETYGFTVKLAWANTARTLTPIKGRPATRATKRLTTRQLNKGRTLDGRRWASLACFL